MVRSGIRRYAALVVLVAGFSLGDQPSPADASPHRPTGLYERFGDCPLSAPVLEDCLFGSVKGGAVTIGRRILPVEKPIIVQGGFYSGVVAEEYLHFVGAEDGNTLPGTQLSIPGGLTGLIAPGYLPATLQTQLNRSSTGVTATLQLARPASAINLSTENFLSATGIALQLPVKVKLSNQFLGENCYIGSSVNPVVLSLTTGATSPVSPNKSIIGVAGEVEFRENFQLLEVVGSELVDNSFAVPAATGCGASNTSIVDAALDAELGLPSAAGHNTAIFYSTFSLAMPSAVRNSE